MNSIKFVRDLVNFSPRQGVSEQKTAKYIRETLRKFSISYKVQNFSTTIPLVHQVKLFVDGRRVPAKSSAFISGKIIGKANIVSSLLPEPIAPKEPNINFNPLAVTEKVISLATFSFAPAIGTNSETMLKILKAKKVRGEILVRKHTFTSQNILVGNVKNPQTIIFCHYDSIETGATDNASGVAVMLDAILRSPEILTKNLFAFCGNEELSYDQPMYWGHGYRMFEKKFKHIMEKCRRFILVDCVGNATPQLSQDKHIQQQAFPVVNLKKWRKKIYLMYGGLDKLMGVYHSTDDNLKQLSQKNLQTSTRLLLSFLNKAQHL